MEILIRLPILANMVFCRFDRFTGHWKGPDSPLVISVALKVGGCRWLRPADAVEDPQPHDHKVIADGIQRSPPETKHRFERSVSDFAYDLGCLSFSG
jgi:hypothetical protein